MVFARKMSSKSTAPKSAGPPAALPTLDDVQKTPGQAVTAEELKKLQTSGALPLGINLAMHPSMHKVKSGQEEYLVIMVDAPPCGCRKVNGKKERCRQHRALRRHKKKTKKSKKMVKDDDSDRQKLGALRHAEDSEEEGDQVIEGAYTPDKICAIGPAGAAIIVAIDTVDNPNAAPRVPVDKKEPIRGILVKGPQDCPQFIPEDKIKGEPKFAHFTRGTLFQNGKGEHVFFPDGGPKPDAKGSPLLMTQEAIEKEVGDKLHVAGIVDVNESGMPVFRQIDVDHPAPQDKLATIGVLATVDGETLFVQTKGQTVGSGDNAPALAVTKDGPQAPGTLLADVIYKDNKIQVVPVGQTGGAEQVGTVVQGDYNQPVLIAKKGGRLDTNGTVCYDAAKVKEMKETEWKALAAAQQQLLKQAAADIEKKNVAVAAALTGKTQEQIRKEMEEAKANTFGPQEVISQSFAQGYQANKSVFMYKGATTTPRGTVKPVAAGGGGYQYNGGEVASVAFTDGKGGSAPRSVFMGGK